MVSAISSAMARDPAARPATAGEFAAAMIGSATLVMGPGMVSPLPVGVALGSEDPTVVSDLPPAPSGQAERTPTRRVRWSLAAALLVLLALAATAMTMDRDPGTAEEGSALAAAATTTTVTSTTTTVPTTTTAPTTTTTIPTTTTTLADTPESVAEDIAGVLAALGPPEFRPREVRQVEERLQRVMEEWQDDDREELRRELERVFEDVDDLESSEEREELTALLVRLADLMGFDVQESGGDDEEDDD
jgi:predicted lipid-binding transport protein (Tim44 family)